MASYTKLRDGSWGVRADGAVKAGQSLTVTKKDGTYKVERVSRVLWSGADSRTGETVSLCEVVKTLPPVPARSNGYSYAGTVTRRPRCPNPDLCGDPCCDGDCGY